MHPFTAIKQRASTLIALFLLVSFLAGPATGASDLAGTIAFELGHGNAIELAGGSTLHDWSSSTQTLAVISSIEAQPGEALDDALLRHRPLFFTLKLPVASFSSGKDKLDSKMRKALAAESHPHIVFTLEDYTATRASADTLELQTIGRLLVAGQERQVTLPVTVALAPEIEISGVTELKMTDHGIKPPTMFFGTLRTHDEVMVRIKLTLRAGSPGQ